jgi:2-keto-4-pentenoate hydratase/2-oxohepta-3-ene-1,7-dioic acid hydratase in catechol pathway
LNGKIVQDASTAELIFDVKTLIALLSEAFTLESGDIIVSGTPAGVGFARKPPLWMKAGDVCEVEIEGVGTLVNPVVDEG